MDGHAKGIFIMILVIGGTSDAREITRKLSDKGIKIVVSTATQYGYDLASGDGVPVVQGRMDCQEMVGFIADSSIQVLVDASHPFAVEVTENAVKACQISKTPYIRYARPGGEEFVNPLVEKVISYEAAAQRACQLGQIIFLTIGSKMCPLFIETAMNNGKEVIVRIIPDPAVIQGLLEMGVSPGNLLAMKGPFSEELNVAMLKHYKADVMVTKESGIEGGLREKVSAAVSLGVPVVMITRPPEPENAVKSIAEAVTAVLDSIREK